MRDKQQPSPPAGESEDPVPSNNPRWQLVDAIHANNLDLLWDLASLNKQSLDDPRLLYASLKWGHDEITGWLLDRDCPVNASDDPTFAPWTSALHAAIYYKRNRWLDVLMDRGAHVLARNPWGESPAVVACKVGNVEALELLLRRDRSIAEIPDDAQHRPLHHAVLAGNYKLVRVLLDYGADVHAAVGDDAEEHIGFMALHLAAKVDESGQIMNLLLDHRADVDASIPEIGVAPIHVAVQAKNKRAVLLLSECNADFRAITGSGESILHFAIKSGWSELLEVLLRKNADPDQRTKDGDAPLHLAVKVGNQDVIKILLAHGADINLKNFREQTPLHLAVESNVGIAKLLLEKKARVDELDEDGETPLSLAIRYCVPETVALILGYDPCIRNPSNIAALISAAKSFKNFQRTVRLLVDYGFPLFDEIMKSRELMEDLVFSDSTELLEYVLSRESQKNPNFARDDHLMNLSVSSNNVKMVKLLLSHGYGVDEESLNSLVDNNNSEMLDVILTSGKRIHWDDLVHTAVRHEDMKMIRVFLDHGLNVNSCDDYGSTVLHFAVWHKHLDLVNYLIDEKRARVDVAETIQAADDVKKMLKETPLHLAVIKKRHDIVLALLESHANVNGKDGRHATALHRAVANASGSLDVVKTLLRYGADINVVDGRKKLAAYHIFVQTCICNAEFGYHYDLVNNCECSIDEDVITELVEIFARHIVYLTSTNKPVDPDNIKLLSAKYKEFEKLLTSCTFEITKMKKVKIHDNVTFYHLLTKKSNALAAYGRNRELTDAFEMSDYEREFPLYAESLREQIDEARSRASLLESGSLALKKLADFDLPRVAIDVVLDFLNLKDLNSLSAV